jgi:hypothetical protein
VAPGSWSGYRRGEFETPGNTLSDVRVGFGCGTVYRFNGTSQRTWDVRGDSTQALLGPPFAVGWGEFRCTDGHARVAIRVNLQQQEAMFPYDWITVDSLNVSNHQAKYVQAKPKWWGSNCFPRTQYRYFRTVVVYGRAFNASGDLVHETTYVYSAKVLLCAG